jgi:hypothetical protein
VEEMVDTLVWVQMDCQDMEFCARDATSPTFTTRRTTVKDVVLYQKYLSRLRLITKTAISETMKEKTFGLYVPIAID